MSPSPSAAPPRSISKSEYYSSLPWFRRCLAMLNWRPVVDFELREIEYKQRMQQLQNESEQLRTEEQQRQIAHEQRMKQLQKESEQLESEIAQIEKETARLDELNSKIDTLLFSSSTSSSPHQSTQGNSED